MSHFTTIKTVLRDRAMVCESLRYLHHEFREGENLSVRGYQGQMERAEIVISTGCDYDIGLRRGAEENYEAVADWDWGVKNYAKERFQREAFLQQINQAYARCAIVQEAFEHGYIVEERVLANKEIEILVSETM
jgi:hypothetical protein